MSKILLNDDTSNKNLNRGQPLVATNAPWGQSAPSTHQQHQSRPQQCQQQQQQPQLQPQPHQIYNSGNYKTPQQAYGYPGQQNIQQQIQPQFRQEGQKGYEAKKSNMSTGYPHTPQQPQESIHYPKKQQQENIQYQKKPLDVVSTRNTIQTSAKTHPDGSRSSNKSSHGQTPHSAFGHVVGGTTSERNSNLMTNASAKNVQSTTAASKRRKVCLILLHR
jgi:hypothetical protein